MRPVSSERSNMKNTAIRPAASRLRANARAKSPNTRRSTHETSWLAISEIRDMRPEPARLQEFGKTGDGAGRGLLVFSAISDGTQS